MAAADREPTPLLGVGVLVPVRLCALLADALRSSQVAALQQVRQAAHEVATDYTARRLRASPGGSSAMAAPGPDQARSDQAGVMLTTGETAMRLRVSQRRVRQLVAAGKLAGAWQDPNGLWWIPRDAVERRAHDDDRGGTSGCVAAAS